MGRDLSAAILDAKFTSIEKLEEVRDVVKSTFFARDPSKHIEATVMSVMPGSDKHESQQKCKLFKTRKESMTVHAELEAKREQHFQPPSRARRLEHLELEYSVPDCPYEN